MNVPRYFLSFVVLLSIMLGCTSNSGKNMEAPSSPASDSISPGLTSTQSITMKAVDGGSLTVIDGPFQSTYLKVPQRHITQDEFFAANPGWKIKDCSFPQVLGHPPEIIVDEIYVKNNDGLLEFNASGISFKTMQTLFNLQTQPNGEVKGKFGDAEIVYKGLYQFETVANPPLGAIMVVPNAKGLPVVCILPGDLSLRSLTLGIVDRDTLVIVP